MKIGELRAQKRALEIEIVELTKSKADLITINATLTMLSEVAAASEMRRHENIRLKQDLSDLQFFKYRGSFSTRLKRMIFYIKNRGKIS